MEDAADLSRLADIVVPPPVPWWPPAPGWWIVAAALLMAVAILLLAVIRHWRRNAYRRQALAEIDVLGPVQDAASVAALSSVLKRTALVAFPREQVAPLTGSGWVAFLDRTGGATFAENHAGLANAAFGAPVDDSAALTAAARRWVKRHRVEG